MEPLDIIAKAYDIHIAKNVINSYKEIENNFVLAKWKTSELDAGHFVESTRRLLESELFGKYTPFNKPLPNFNNTVLSQYEEATGHESFRILIPKTLKTIYNIRNKRGVGHINEISPNEIDATYILYSVKWILSEIIRLKSSLSFDETQRLISKIIERKVELLWKTDTFTRVLNPDLSTNEKILVLLLDKSPLSVKDLQNSIGYKNTTDFHKKLQKLHNEILIYYDRQTCLISPTGVILAEEIILKAKNKKLFN